VARRAAGHARHDPEAHSSAQVAFELTDDLPARLCRAALPYWDEFLRGIGLTLLLSVLAVAIGFVIGLVTVLARRSRWVGLRLAAVFYVEAIRNTPFLLQVMFIFFGLPSAGVSLTPWPAAILALSLNCGAFACQGDTLAVVRLDRLGRSLAELLATVTMLKQRGIALLSLEEKIDTSSAAGELVFHVFGAIAHFERRLIAERTKDGIAAARVRGKLPGRQPLDADRISAALKLVAARLSPTNAARQIGLGRSTVYREIKRTGLQPAL
jgi:His/Glu/Gln/Arg/opine family amino acid ABC transporter permease subunit